MFVPSSGRNRRLRLNSLLINLSLSLFLLSHLVSAIPSKRADLPDASLTLWRDKIKPVFNGKTCVFYYKAGPNARDYAAANGKITIWDTYDNNEYMNFEKDPLKSWKLANREIEYFQRQSQIFAERCIGRAEKVKLYHREVIAVRLMYTE